jgi:hypothetical protein
LIWAATKTNLVLQALRLATPVILLILRGVVRSRDFWVKGLQQAVYDKGTVTDFMVDSYRCPQLAKEWDIGLLLFVTARLTAVR